MSNKFNDFLNEQLQDPEIKKEYDDLQPERAIIQALIDARLRTGMTQKELSERTGIAQGDISKLERGNSNPSIRTLQRLAAGMGMSIQLKFIPNGNVWSFSFSDSVVEEKTWKKEFDAFTGIPVYDRKVVITNDDMDFSTSAVEHIRLADFLRNTSGI